MVAMNKIEAFGRQIGQQFNAEWVRCFPIFLHFDMFRLPATASLI
jgi:hypothetical protein